MPHEHDISNRSHEAMPGITPSDKHRHMASDMKADLARFAKQLGYENDLDDDDLNHALSEVAEEISAQKLQVDPKNCHLECLHDHHPGLLCKPNNHIKGAGSADRLQRPGY